MITVDFKNFNEMMTFAKQLAGLEPTIQPVQTEILKQEKKDELVKDKTEQAEGNSSNPERKSNSPEKAGEESEEKEATAYTLPEVRARLAELQKAGKRSQVQALIKSYGVDKLTEIPEEKYAALMERAGEI